MEGKCKFHGKVKYLYVKSAGAKLCDGCLQQGFYKTELYDEAKAMYPEHFADLVVSTTRSGRFQSLKPNQSGKPQESADVAQLVEQLIRNEQVGGSSPPVSSTLNWKLVRDQIPHLNPKAEYRAALTTDMPDLFAKKLLEETVEAALEIRANTRMGSSPKMLEELADVLEIVDAVTRYCGIDPKRLEEVRRKKSEEKGSFASLWSMRTRPDA